MSDSKGEGLKGKITRQGEEAVAKIAQELLSNELVSGAFMKALGARERAVQAQDAAMAAFNIPTASDMERLTRRVRSVGQRLEGIEDVLDRLEERLTTLDKGLSKPKVTPKRAPAKRATAPKTTAVRAAAAKKTAAAASSKRVVKAKSAPAPAKPAAAPAKTTAAVSKKTTQS